MNPLSFVLYNTLGPPITGYALGSYRPLNIKKDGEKIRNPAFDDHSQHILNLKEPQRGHYFNSAVTYFGTHLAGYMKSLSQIEHAEFVIVPSSKQGAISPGLEKVVQAVCRQDKRFTYKLSQLSREKTIEKLAKGGDRSLPVHLNSLNYRSTFGAPTVKLVFDDVMTSGNSLIGAITVMQQVQYGLTYIPLVLGKTTHD